MNIYIHKPLISPHHLSTQKPLAYFFSKLFFYIHSTLLTVPYYSYSSPSKTKQPIKISTLYIAALLTATTNTVSAQEKLIFSTFKTSTLSIICENIMRAAYKNIDIEIEVIKMPGKRALFQSTQGHVDGELFRGVIVAKDQTSLIMIPIPIVELDLVVLSTGVEFEVNGWESLRPYKIGVERGFELLEKHTAGMNVFYASSSTQIIQLLNSGRIETTVLPRIDALETIKKFQLTNIKILSPPIYKDKVYHFLHKKNKHLLNQLTATLELMKINGEIDRIKEQTLIDLELSHL